MYVLKGSPKYNHTYYKFDTDMRGGGWVGLDRATKFDTIPALLKALHQRSIEYGATLAPEFHIVEVEQKGWQEVREVT